MIHFEHPTLLYLLLLLPALIGVWIWLRHCGKKRLSTFADSNMFGRLIPDASTHRPWIKYTLILLGLGLLIIALANPQVGSKMVKGKQQGSDIAICLDISNSMMAEDLQPNRLERSKHVVNSLMKAMAGDRVSLIVFAGTSYIQMPLTNDYSAAKMFLDQITCDIIETQGTAIGDAIETAMKTFGYGDPDREWERRNSRAIIVISDGENHEDDATAVAKEAHNEGIMVCTIGMGLPEGVPIPEYASGHKTGYKHDREGNTVTTRLNEEMLTEIAHAGGGVYLRAGNINAGLHEITKRIENLEKENFGEAMFSEYESCYLYPLAAALVCLIIELLIFERKNRRLNWEKLLKK